MSEFDNDASEDPGSSGTLADNARQMRDCVLTQHALTEETVDLLKPLDLTGLSAADLRMVRNRFLMMLEANRIHLMQLATWFDEFAEIYGDDDASEAWKRDAE